MKNIILSMLTVPILILVFYFLGILSYNIKKKLKFYYIGLTLLFVFSLPLTSYILGYPLLELTKKNNQEDQNNIEVIVVLTGGIYKNLEGDWLPSNSTFNRMSLAKSISNKKSYPIIISGGKTIKQAPSEAFIANDFFNIANSTLEQESLNTHESAYYLKNICLNLDGNILLITSKFHSLRSYLVFKSHGCNVITYPYKTGISYQSIIPSFSSLSNINRIIYEYIAITYYISTGKIVFFN